MACAFRSLNMRCYCFSASAALVEDERENSCLYGFYIVVEDSNATGGGNIESHQNRINKYMNKSVLKSSVPIST